MKRKLIQPQWWRSPPALILSVIAAALLLFCSGKAAVQAFAEGEEERTFVLQYITDDPAFTTGTTYGENNLPASIVTAAVADDGKVSITISRQPQMDRRTFKGWEIADHSTETDSLFIGVSYKIPVSYFQQVGDTNTYVTTATATFKKALRIVLDKNTTDSVSMTTRYDYFDSDYPDGRDLPTGTSPVSRRGYSVKNWSLTPGGSDTYVRITTDLFTEDKWDSTANRYVLTLYANWEAAYRISYYYNVVRATDDFEDEVGATGTRAIDPNVTVTRDGYTLLGWATDNTNNPANIVTSVRYPDDFTLASPRYLVTVYPVWEERTYQFHYEANLPQGVTNSNVTDSTVLKNYSEITGGYTFEPSSPQADGGEFKGWTITYTMNDGGTYRATVTDPRWFKIESNKLKTNTTNEYTITANWKKLYQLHFDPNADGDSVSYQLGSNGGTGITSDSFDGNGDYAFYFTTNPTRTGYVFAGCSTTPDGPIVTKINEADFNTVADGKWNATLYGHWKKVPVITYYSDFPDYAGEQLTAEQSGKISPEKSFINWDINLWDRTVIENATKGYQFFRWKADDGNEYEGGTNVVIEQDTDLHAVWNKQCVLSYNKQAASGPGDNMPGQERFTVRSDELTESPTHALSSRIPGYSNHVFKGWSLTPGGNELITEIPISAFALNESGVAFEATVYAIWESKSITVTYDANLTDGIEAANMPADVTFTYDSLENGEWVNSDRTPSAPGHSFVQWDTQYINADGEVTDTSTSHPGSTIRFSFETTSRVTMTARWHKYYTIYYNFNVEEGVTISDGIHGQIPEKAEFTESGFTDGKYSLNSDDHLHSSYYRTDDSDGHSYVWKGWAKTADASPADSVTQLDDADFIYNASTDRYEATVYSIWQRKAEITLHSIDDNIGSDRHEEPHTQIFKSDNGFTDWNVPYPTGSPNNYHDFLWWTTNEDGTGTKYEPGDKITTDEDLHLYAQRKRRFRVVYYPTSPYNGNGSTISPNQETFAVPVTDITDDSVHTFFDVEPVLTGQQDRFFLGWSLTLNGGVNDILSNDGVLLRNFVKDSGVNGAYTVNVYSVWSEKPYTLLYEKNLPDEAIVKAFSANETALTYSQVRRGYPLSSTVPKAAGFVFDQYKTYSEYISQTSQSGYGSNVPGGGLRYVDFLSESQQVRAVAQWRQKRQFVLHDNADDDTVTQFEYRKDPVERADFTAQEAFDTDYVSVSRTAHALDYWSLTPDGTRKLTGQYPMVDAAEFAVNESADRYECHLYAMWKRHYAVRYDGNAGGDRVTNIPSPDWFDSFYESTLTEKKALRDYTPTRTGYTFKGWALSPDSGAVLTDSAIALNLSTFTLNHEKEYYEATVYAVWEANRYTVTYKDSENASAQYADTGISGDYTLLGIADTGFTAPEGKTFDGWKLVTPDDKGYPAQAQAGGSIHVVSNVTYEAHWKSSTNPPVNPTATIRYTSGLTEDYPGYNESCANPFVINDVPATAEYAVLGNDPQSEGNPSFAPDGYTFAGWKLVPSAGSSPRPTAISGGAGSDGLYHEGDTIATDDLAGGSVTLKAVWQVMLQYDANGGTGDLPENGEAIPVLIDGSATAASGGNLTRSGARFSHWNTKANDNGAKYQPGQSFTLKDNTVLYAIYTDSPGDDTGSDEPGGTHLTVTYNANGGTGDVPKATKEYSAGDTVNVASKGDLARTGATFKEWNTKPDGSGTGYKGDGTDSFTITADTTLYAIWTDENGKILPNPGTGESAAPMILAFSAALFSLAAFAFLALRERRRKGNAEAR